MSEFGFHVLAVIISDLSAIYPCNRNDSEHVIGRVGTEIVVYYESQHQRNEHILFIKKCFDLLRRTGLL